MNVQRLVARLALLALALSGAACFTMHAELPGALRGDVVATDVVPVGRVSVEQKNWFFLWGLVGGPDSRLFADELQRQITAAHGDGVQELTIDSQFECMDVGVACVTAGCIEPRTYRASGTIVRIRKAPLPGNASSSTERSPPPAASILEMPPAPSPDAPAPIAATY